MTFGQLAKFTSAMYSELPPGEKVAWNQRAESDKQRFMHELASYVPPPGYNAKGDSLDNATTGGSEKSSKKVSRVSSSNVNRSTRDPNAPRRNMSAYLLYQNCMREQFKQLNPGITFGQLAKYTRYVQFDYKIVSFYYYVDLYICIVIIIFFVSIVVFFWHSTHTPVTCTNAYHRKRSNVGRHTHPKIRHGTRLR
jgi:hypothetical protein